MKPTDSQPQEGNSPPRLAAEVPRGPRPQRGARHGGAGLIPRCGGCGRPRSALRRQSSRARARTDVRQRTDRDPPGEDNHGSKGQSFKEEFIMAKCDACVNDYDKSFQVVARGKTHTFDSFECAIHALAPAPEKALPHTRLPAKDRSRMDSFSYPAGESSSAINGSAESSLSPGNYSTSLVIEEL